MCHRYVIDTPGLLQPGSTLAEGVAAGEGKLFGAVGAGWTQGLLAGAPDLG